MVSIIDNYHSAYDSLRVPHWQTNWTAAVNLLDGQISIVTGAGQGLGRAVALEFAKEGSIVALLERNFDTLAKVLSEINNNGGQAEAYEIDITDYDAYRNTVSDIVTKKWEDRRSC